MVVMPTERDAEAWSKDRFSPMARDTPCLVGKIADPKSRDGSNKILHKRFPGGHLTIVGANAPSGLASRPIRILLCDEVDRYPFSAGAEGDPVNLAKKRTVTFWNRKVVLVSTPTIRGASRIETAYAESDQRQYWVPCPSCGTHQVLVWGQVRWDSPAGGHANGGHAMREHRPETARYHCIACDAGWSDAMRWAAIRRGEWRAQAPFKGIAGFHLNEIYSSWVRREAMVRGFLSARAGGDEAEVVGPGSIGGVLAVDLLDVVTGRLDRLPPREEACVDRQHLRLDVLERVDPVPARRNPLHGTPACRRGGVIGQVQRAGEHGRLHPPRPDRAAELVRDDPVLQLLDPAAELDQPSAEARVVGLADVAGDEMVGQPQRGRDREQRPVLERLVAAADVGR